MAHLSEPDPEEFARRRLKMYETFGQKIAQDGFAIVGVLDPAQKEDMFLYTIGLTEKGLPELLFTGVPPEFREYTTHLLDLAAQLLRKTGFGHGDTIHVGKELGLDRELKVEKVRADDPRYYLGFALGYYGKGNVEALVLLPVLDDK